MTSHAAFWLSGLSVLLLTCLSASIALADDARAPTTAPSPKPELTPREVAKAVVEALQKNDANDSGIKTTWEFASPGNQQITGPIEKFIPMVKTPQYLPMLNSKSTEIKELSVDENTAAELAIITATNGDKAYYLFQLTKQTDGKLKDCWMTDGVQRVVPREKPAAPVNPPLKLPDGQSPV